MTNCCDDFGTCTRGANCQARAGTVPPEAGNVRLPPVDYDDPLSHTENMALVRTLVAWLAGVLCFVAVVSLAVSYSTEAHADVLWAFLAGLS